MDVCMYVTSSLHQWLVETSLHSEVGAVRVVLLATLSAAAAAPILVHV